MAVLGNLPLATRILKFLGRTDRVEVVGAVHGGKEKAYPCLINEVSAATYCKSVGIRSLKIEELTDLGLDLAVSARNDSILSRETLSSFTLGTINCHGGFLPEYAGVGGHIFPLLNGETHTGASIHWMTEDVDAGPIIARKKIQIEELDTGLDLFMRINDALFDLFCSNFDAILEGSVEGVPQSRLGYSNREKKRYYYRKDDISNLSRRLTSDRNVQSALAWV